MPTPLSKPTVQSPPYKNLLLRTFFRDLTGASDAESVPGRYSRTTEQQHAQILREQIALLNRSTPAWALMSMCGAGIVVGVLWRHVPWKLLLGWALVIGLVLVMQLALYFRYVHRQLRSHDTSVVPSQIALAMEALTWASTLFVFTPRALEYELFLVLVIVIIAFAVAVYYSVHLPTLYAFDVPLLLVASTALVLQGSSVLRLVGIGMIAVLGTIIALRRNFNQTLTRAIATNLRNRELVGELVTQKEAAEKANLAKTRFLAAASHDLRQPMHTIGLLVSVLRERIRYPEVGQLVERIQAAVNTMENLFSGLLDISKLDAVAIKPRIREFEIGNLLRLIEANYLPQAQARNLQLKVVHSAAIIKSDPTLLERMLGNLVSNAIRYTTEGRVLVGCRRREEKLSVQVLDTGIGIPEQHLGEIFEEFFQVANPERDRNKGLGLGLSIFKRTAELLGHSFHVSSRVGKGSMFTVEVPIVNTAPQEYAASSTADTENRLRGAFIVFVEDEQDIRFAMEALCKQWGCHLVSAASTRDALEQLRTHLRAPDLVICDYRLRDGLNGLMAIRDIRQEANEDIPAMIITGDISVGEIREISDNGILVVQKPINGQQLRQFAEHLLGLHPVIT